MFTGLIREIGKIKGLTPGRGVVRVEVEATETARQAKVGDSIALDGICLTVTAVRGRTFSVEAVNETRRLTTLTSWRRGDKVHLEPALRAGDPLDGHLVQGHVDGIGSIANLKKAGGSLQMTVTLSDSLARYLTPKGSVAIDGVSLTVDEGPFDRGQFTVNLIPHTLGWTKFGSARSGQKVNLEMDVLVKAARGAASWSDIPSLDKTKTTSPKPGGLTLERLLASGFKGRGSKGRP